MLSGNDILISLKYSRKYYVDLGLSLDSSSDVWRIAVSILKDRIKGRYLDSIKTLLEAESGKNDFSAMALMCLLIDTFMQFRFGLPRNVIDDSGSNYVRFMSKNLHFHERDAHRFYVDIRCGLLHSAETSNGSILDPVHDPYAQPIKSFHLEGKKTFLIVNALSMYNKLEAYFNSYCNELLDSDNNECRKNFIIKMDSIAMKLDFVNGDYELWTAICNQAGKLMRDFNGKSFSYSISRYEQTLRLKMEGSRGRIDITFLDIKEYLHFPKPRGRYVVNSWFIESILKKCKDEVIRYTQNNVA